MDAAALALHQSDDRPEKRTPLRLRHAPISDPVDSVVETFLGGDRTVAPSESSVADGACGDTSCETCVPLSAPVEFKPLRLRCPKASSVVIGVEPTGRVCLEVHVGAGVGVSRVLGELEEAERWLRSSAHDVAMAPTRGRLDMSVPIRRCVTLEDPSIGAGSLARAGIEVRGTPESRN